MKCDEIMTIKDVAKYLRLHFLTVYRLAHEGKIPVMKIGRQWRFKRSLLEKWMEDKIGAVTLKR